MSAFDKIIGYEPEKRELRKLCEMMQNSEALERLGAKPSRGLLISGNPGLGKSLMAKCLMEESGRKAYILRRNKPGNDFINEIHKTFMDAAEHQPAIILLDDMDKFVVEDDSREEYVVLQAAIDEVADKNVFVIATVNNMHGIPDSLTRAGRFDRTLKIYWPNQSESEQIIAHYLSDKPLASSVYPPDVAKMVSGKSCAEMESILNEAALNAVSSCCKQIEMQHIVEAFLSIEHSIKDPNMSLSEKEAFRIAYHEAGHAVAQDLAFEGGVGFVTVLNAYRQGAAGFLINCRENRTEHERLLVTLGGIAAEELVLGAHRSGGESDLQRAKETISRYVVDDGTMSLSNIEIDNRHRVEPSPTLMARIEIVIATELERYLGLVRSILSRNRPFLDAVAKELLEKNYLLNSDIRRIRKSCVIDQTGCDVTG